MRIQRCRDNPYQNKGQIMLNENEIEKSGDSVADVVKNIETEISTQKFTTVTTNSTQVPDLINLSAEQSVRSIILNGMSKFVPRELLKELIESELKRFDLNLTDSAANLTFVEAFDKILFEYAEDKDWKAKLDIIFDGVYPDESREFYFNGFVCQKTYPKAYPHQVFKNYTFVSKNYQPIANIKNELVQKLAPATYNISKDAHGEPYLVRTAETVRFANYEKKAFLNSSLHEAVIFDRPVYNILSGWDKFNRSFLPRKIYAAQILSESCNKDIIDAFLLDLKTTFSWDEKTSSFVSYLGYLIQPMIVHLAPGQMPGYLFVGPTKSGKNFLAQALPEILYNRMGKSSVLVKKLPSNTYEMDVFLSAATGSIFLVFDEVKNATDEELKSLDSFLTSSKVQTRKMRHGYIEIDNYFVVGLTSVHKGLTDETEGRLAKLALTESRPQQIAEFCERWKDRAPDLLSAIFHAVNEVSLDYSKLPKISDRRPGFNILAYFIEQVFKLKPDYTVEITINDFLDDICLMYEEVPEVKNARDGRASVKQLREFLHKRHNFRYSRDRIISDLNTALGYGSTEKHPSYKESGYEAENGKHYHVKFIREGLKVKRWFIYVRCIDDKNVAEKFEQNFDLLVNTSENALQAEPAAH